MKKIETHHWVIITLLIICAAMLIITNSRISKAGHQLSAQNNSEETLKSKDGGTDQMSNPVYEVIMKRKSVRAYTNEKVSDEILEKIIRAGMAAPTAGNKQPWSFVAVTDREKLDLLSESHEYAKMLADAPAAIVVCGVPAWGLEGEDNEYWVQDCSAASQNILLAVESMGLGAVWTGVYPIRIREKNVREILDIPEDVVPLNIIAIGYPEGEHQPKDKFKPERIHWNKW